MIHKITQKVETFNNNTHKIITKSFQRGLQTIETKSAYIDDKLYYRDWVINSYNKKRVIKQTYNAGHPIKGSRIDIQA